MRLPRPLARLRRNRRGASITEYGLLVGLVAVLAIVAVQQSGDRISGLLATVSNELGTVENAVNSTAAPSASGSGDEPAAPSNCPNVGDVCDDGTVYAGELAIDGAQNRKLYTTTADAGAFSWNNGTDFGLPRDTSNWPYLGLDSRTDGAGNTAVMLSATDKGAPYEAAAACQSLNTAKQNGHADWYLPADDELRVLKASYSTIGGFTDGAIYWSSTERPDSAPHAARRVGMGGNDGGRPKYQIHQVRCVRAAS